MFCWEPILHESLEFLHVLGAEALIAFVPDDVFKHVCITTLENRDVFFQSKKGVCFVTCIKHSDS